ncbi:TetR/AcrR family transcriptional regulator [Arthrobacter sp. AZCC_0090]|uniref:TetR/AcrR family transcriptional regulator n=1 Tax=Arthrobacter sp. AZCC_0090 TaxID=2735881 RepID=UPI0016123F96|nr:TetR/AcrR family transcriptional regulator [Arthrobacter sp. AZCC_0090]MBB6403241.1 AcrR family transcriptional regulator [Arthrobacter sp. AZCC_0090]
MEIGDTGSTPKGAATRSEILRVAANVFARKGFEQTRMDDIIREVGLTKGAIYFHFSSKALLAQAVVDEQKARWLRRVQEEILSKNNPPEELRNLGEFMVRTVLSDSSAWGVVHLANQLASVKGHPGGTSPLAAWVDLVAGILQRGRASGVLTFSGDPSDAATVIVAAFDGLKSVTDALDPRDLDAFERRATLLLQILERQFISS